MKFYLFFCISLILVNRGFPRYAELLNTKKTLHSTENTAILSTENVMTCNTESDLNSTINADTPNTESTLISTENTVTSNFENTSTTIRPEPTCPENMLSSPWRPMAIKVDCYCEYPFLPLPMNGTCFELFMRGPCQPGHFLVQPSRVKGNVPLPRCVPNPCLEDGLVPYNETCHNIVTHPLCEDGNLYFREATSDLKCLLLIRPRTVINVPARRRCLYGSRADRNGRCRKTL